MSILSTCTCFFNQICICVSCKQKSLCIKMHILLHTLRTLTVHHAQRTQQMEIMLQTWNCHCLAMSIVSTCTCFFNQICICLSCKQKSLCIKMHILLHTLRTLTVHHGQRTQQKEIMLQTWNCHCFAISIVSTCTCFVNQICICLSCKQKSLYIKFIWY